MKVSIADAIERLGIVNNKIWHLEEKLEENPSVALKIREFNRERVAIKNYLNEVFGSGFQETKIDHASASQ